MNNNQIDCDLCFDDDIKTYVIKNDYVLCDNCDKNTSVCVICKTLVIHEDCFNDNMWNGEICDNCNEKYNIEIEIEETVDCRCDYVCENGYGYIRYIRCDSCKTNDKKQNNRIEYVKNCVSLLSNGGY